LKDFLKTTAAEEEEEEGKSQRGSQEEDWELLFSLDSLEEELPFVFLR
jgi:hypothetical protein